MKKLVVFTVSALFCCLVVLSGCGENLTEADKQLITQMDEQLRRSYDGDLLEFRDGSFAVVTNKNDFGLATKYVIGNSVRQSYESLARNVRVVYIKGQPGRCEALEKFIASF